MHSIIILYFLYDPIHHTSISFYYVELFFDFLLFKKVEKLKIFQGGRNTDSGSKKSLMCDNKINIIFNRCF